MTRQCAPITDLRAYSLGTMGPEEAEVVERHLDDCAECCLVLERVESEADELVAGLRGAGVCGPVVSAPEVEHLVERLRNFGSTCSLRAGDTSENEGRFELASALELGSGSGVSESTPVLHPFGPPGPVPASAAELKEAICESGMFSDEEFEAILTLAPAEAFENSLSLARWLVEQRHLTCYQAGELCLGRSHGLLLDENLLLEEVGRGGMGCVYRARNVRMGRVVAVKFLAPHLFCQEDTRERFRRETRAIAAISHPHVLTAYDAGQYAGGEYLVMEYATGSDLGQLVRHAGPLNWQRVVHYIHQAALGLAAAHKRGILHRDVKPSNLMAFLDGTVKVADLGLARFVAPADSRDNLTSAGHVMGTLDYMSPEQAFESERVDERSDIYSLGWTLFHLLTGEVPYRDASGWNKLRAHREGPIPSLREAGLDVPERLDALFQRMVAKDPADRPPSMGEVVEVLATLLPDKVDASLPAEAARNRTPDQDAFFQDLAVRVRHALAVRPDRASSLDADPPVWTSRRFVAITAGLAGCAALVIGAYLLIARPYQSNERPANSAIRADVAVPVAPEVAPEVAQREEAPQRAGLAAAPEPQVVEQPEFAPERETLFGEIGQVQIPQRVTAIALSPDKSMVFAASGDKTIYGIDVATMSIQRRWTGHRAPVNDLAVSEDGAILVTCSGDRTMRVWDVETGDVLREIRLPVPPYRVAISPDGRLLLAALMVRAPVFPRPGILPENRDFRSLMLFDAETGAVARQITEDRETFFWSVAFSPDGGRIAAGSQQGSIVVIDVSNGDVVRELPNRPGPTHCLLFTADGERLYAGNALFIHCFGMNEGATVYRYGLRHAITGLDVGADESRLLAEGTIDVRVVDTDLVGPEAVTNLHGHDSPISGLLFLADETQAISSAWDGTVRRWKLPVRR